MKIEYTFRNLEPSETIKDYAAEKIGKLQKYFRAPLDVEVTFSQERYQFNTYVKVNTDGLLCIGHEESEDIYASVDKVIDKVRTQVIRSKGTTQKHRSDSPPAE